MANEQEYIPTAEDMLEQLSFIEVVDKRKVRPSDEFLERAKQITQLAYNMSVNVAWLMGDDPAPYPDGITTLKQQFLASVQRMQGLINLTAPYISVAEEALTAPDGSNPLLANDMSVFFLVLNCYFAIFEVTQIPEELSTEEKHRFTVFLGRFVESLDTLERGESIVEDYDRVQAVLDMLIREGRMDPVMTEDERQHYIQHSPRTLSPLTRSHRAYMPVSKVARKQLMAAVEPLLVDVGGGAAVESHIWVAEGVTLDEFDIEIQNTIGEMVQHNGDRAITATPAQIFRECAALMDKEKVSPDMESMVVQSIDKMLLTRAAIDYSQQVQKHKRMKKQRDVDYDNIRIEGHLIEGRKLTVNAGGHMKIAYRFYDKPMYYAYSHAIGQIAAVNKKLLNTSQSGDAQKTRKNTRDFVVLKRILAREVERMKRESKKNGGLYEPRLSYAKIQEEVGLQEATEKQLRTLRGDIDYLCELWMSLGHIKNYEKYKVGKAFSGVKIEL